MRCIASSNRCIATSNKCLTSSNKKLLGTSASTLNEVHKCIRCSMLDARQMSEVFERDRTQRFERASLLGTRALLLVIRS